MNLVMLDIHPVPQWIETGGQIAAIVIGLFLIILIVLSVILHLVMALAVTWLHEKSAMIKMLRPNIEAVNKASETALEGVVAPAEDENAVVKLATAIPVHVRKVDKKVSQVGEHVAGAVIEFRARTVQAKTVVKAFLLPGLLVRERRVRRREQAPASKSPDDRELTQENLPVEPPADQIETRPIASGQLKHVSVR